MRQRYSEKKGEEGGRERKYRREVLLKECSLELK